MINISADYEQGFNDGYEAKFDEDVDTVLIALAKNLREGNVKEAEIELDLLGNIFGDHWQDMIAKGRYTYTKRAA